MTPSPGSSTSSCIVPLAPFPYNCCVALHMLEPTPDAFNWPERPSSSSDSPPEVKLERAPDSKAFYVPASTTPTFASKPQPVSSAPPPIRRHSSSSSGALLRRSKQPYSTSPHEARIRNKYTCEATKMSGANFPQNWVKTEGGGCRISSMEDEPS